MAEQAKHTAGLTEAEIGEIAELVAGLQDTARFLASLGFRHLGKLCIRAAALIERLASPRGGSREEVAEGWVLFPREPSREMWAAMGNALVGYKQRHHDKVAEVLWNSLLALRPSGPQAAEGEEEARLLKEADHVFDQDNWESTCPDLGTLIETAGWDRDYDGSIHRLGRLKAIPDAYVVNLPESFDDEGEPEDWDVRMFSNVEAAKAAWAIEAARREAASPTLTDAQSGEGKS